MKALGLARRIAPLVGILTVVCALGGGRAIAATPDESQASRLYLQGKYSEAAAKFIDLYLETSDPIFLRNLARCYYQMKMPDEAIGRFREYLAKARRVPVRDREEVEGYIREMEDLRHSRGDTPSGFIPGAATRGDMPPPVDLAPVPPPPPGAEAMGQPLPANPGWPPPLEQQGPPVLQAPPPPPENPGFVQPVPQPIPGTDEKSSAGSTYTKLALGCGIAGALGLVVGAAYTVAWNTALKDARTQYDPSKESKVRTDSSIAWAGYALGAAGTAGAIFFLIKAHGNGPGSTVSIAPLLGPATSGLALGIVTP